MFLKTRIRENGIPFPLKLDVPNKETIKAIEKGHKIIFDKNSKSYDNINNLRKGLETEKH
nr:type II toxin-antitoxin system RelB/DinJ family antitoxin [Streptobacillus felis]